MKLNIAKVIVPVLTVSLVVSLGGCASKTSGGKSSDSPSASASGSASVSANPELAGKTVSENGVLGDWVVTMQGAEAVDLSDGRPALLVYFDFTNNSQTSTSPFLALDVSAFQSGRQLTRIKTFDDLNYLKNTSLRVRPGVTNRCSVLYDYIPSDGNVTVIARDWTGKTNNIVVKDYSPDSLPGENGSFELKTISDPNFTSGLASEGTLKGATFLIVETPVMTTGTDGKRCVRLYVNMDNGSGSTINFAGDLIAAAYQDGVELQTVTASDAVPEDTNGWADIPSGGKVSIAQVYELRSTSPVEYEISDPDGAKIAKVFSVA